MDATMLRTGLLLVTFAAVGAQAADMDEMDGLHLYNKECAVCHGNLARKAGATLPDRPVRLAMSAQGGRRGRMSLCRCLPRPATCRGTT